MSLEVILGPMFAGKSSMIHSIVSRYESLHWNILPITHSIDTRYSSEPVISNHNLQMIRAIASPTLMSLITGDEYKRARLIVVDEAQFFEDIVEFVKYAVDIDGKNCIVVGLDGDAQRRPFGHLLEIIPLCNKVTKLTSMCAYCKDGTPAIFTLAIDSDAARTVSDGNPCIGSSDKYIPVCRSHYLAGGELLIKSDITKKMPVVTTELIGRI